MKNRITSLLIAFYTLLTVGLSASAQNTEYKLHKYTPNDGGILTNLSANGKWAIIKLGTTSGSGNAQPMIYNVETEETKTISIQGNVFDMNAISNDGNVIVGSFYSRPAAYFIKEDKIKLFPLRNDWVSGELTSMTPDGKYAVGHYNGYLGQAAEEGLSYDYYYSPLLVNVETGDTIHTPGLPKKDMAHEDKNTMRFSSITPDGRYIIGNMSWNYLSPISAVVFLYDTVNKNYKVIGFDEKDKGPWTPKVQYLHHVEGASFSPDGKWLCARAYMAKPIEGSEFYTDMGAPLRYNIAEDKLEVLEGLDLNIEECIIDNAGTFFGNPNTGSPLRDFRVLYKDKYWISFAQIVKSNYGFDFNEKTGFDRTGTITNISNDGKTLIAFVDPLGESYCFELGQTIEEACSKVDLMSNYSISPANNSEFSQISTIEINFGRTIGIVGKGNTHLHLYKSDGTKVADGLSTNGLSIKATSKSTLVAQFRTRNLEEGTNYYVTIDAGAVCVAGDETITNKEIKINYKGRKAAPVEMVKITPEPGATLKQLDAESYILIDFDSPVKLTDHTNAYIKRVVDGSILSTLSMAEGNTESTKKEVLLIPSNTVYLYEGLEYMLVIDSASVCDYSGSSVSFNKEINVIYKGSYSREVTGETILFKDNFNNIAESENIWLRYEGDHNTPLASMAAWGFDKDNTPWSLRIAQDESYTNPCAGSHSMYAPSAQSDDWLMTPQIVMPDEGKVYLRFNAQSYNSEKKDSLWIYIYEDERVLSFLNDRSMETIKANTMLLDSIELVAGQAEITEGEWVEYKYDISKWDGKHIYIAFVNKNYNKSAVFIDDVFVEREIRYALSFSNPERVVAQNEIQIAGNITVKTDDEINSMSLCLKDENGKEIAKKEWPSITGNIKDFAIPFSFDNKLPLTLGKINKYTIDVQLGDKTDQYKGQIYNLAFQTTKRVILEEKTGIDCQNCPLGIVTIEKCERQFGDRFIPISIHTYVGDPYMGQFEGYSSYLGLSAAPSARINRVDGIYSPIISVGGKYVDTYPDEPLWIDIVTRELNKETVADINIKSNMTEDGKNISSNIDLRYALNETDQQLSLLLVILEDGLVNYQVNSYGTVSQDVLGEWGLNGKYAATETGYAYPITHNDVVRGLIGMNMNGTIGLFPSTIEANKVYSTNISGKFPESIDDPNNASVVAVLIDTQTGEVINAAKAHVEAYDPTGIESTTANAETVATEYYTLSGIRINNPSAVNGTVIRRIIFNDGTVKTEKILKK